MKHALFLLYIFIFLIMFSSCSYGAGYQSAHTMHSGLNNRGINTLNSGSISGRSHVNPIPTTIHTQPGMLPPPTNVMPGGHVGYGMSPAHGQNRPHVRRIYRNSIYPSQYYYSTTYSQPYMYTTTSTYYPVTTTTYTTAGNGYTWTTTTQQLTPWQRFLQRFSFW